MLPKAIGLLGGTFNPIHYGHLRLAEELATALDLAEVRFIPTGTPPHRAAPKVSVAERLAMVRKGVEANPRFHADDSEAVSAGPHYTIDTLRRFRASLGSHQPLCLMMGADAFLGLSSWREWKALFDYAHIAVAERPGFSSIVEPGAMPSLLEHAVMNRMTGNPATLREKPAGSVFRVDITALDISSSKIRGYLRSAGSPRYLLPDAVLGYIQEKGLYKAHGI